MSPPPLLLEAAGLEDVPALVELEQSCFSHPWTSAHFRGEIEAGPGARVLVLRESSLDPKGTYGILGYCILRSVVDELHIKNLAVHADLRRQGLGRWLLRVALSLGLRLGARAAYLEVRRANAAAVALYQSEGFVAAGVRTGYYRDPEEDALVFSRTLAPGAFPGDSSPPPFLEKGLGAW